MVGLYQSYNPSPQKNRKTRVTIHKTFSQFSDKSAGSYRRIPLVSLAGFFVRLVNPVPSTFIAYNSRFPSRVDTNPIFVPSGDQKGFQSSAGLRVRLLCPDPSERIR